VNARPARSRPPRRAAARNALLVLALLAAAGAAAWWGTHRPTAATAPAPPDPLASMPPESIYAEAVRRVGARHSFESLPLFRRALAARPDAPPAFHAVYGIALYNSLFETDTLAGCVRARWRTSLERSAAAHEGFDHMARAIRDARSPADRALYCDRLGRQLTVLGFEWEALRLYQEAATLDPRNPAYVRQHDALLSLMRDPARYAATPEADAPTLH
jgi:hypothetical protein